MNLITRLRMIVRKDEGQDLLEYALLVALIAIVAVTAVGLAGVEVNDIFTTIKDKLIEAQDTGA
jgi:pilus assembly protein Flp/PilA